MFPLLSNPFPLWGYAVCRHGVAVLTEGCIGLPQACRQVFGHSMVGKWRKETKLSQFVNDRERRSYRAVNFWLNERNLLLKSTFHNEVLTSNAACMWWGLEAVRSTSLLVSVVWMCTVHMWTVRTKSHLNRGDLSCSITATLCAFWSSEHILKLISLRLGSNWLRVGLGECSGSHLWALALCPAHLQGSAWALLWCLNRGCAGPRPKQFFFGELLFP